MGIQDPPYPNPVRFQLIREEDVTGISGTGHVADGIVFTDGAVAMRWRTSPHSIGLYDSIDDVVTIHGHNGATRVEYTDGLDYLAYRRMRAETEADTPGR